MSDKVLNRNTISSNLIRAQYAVRGELAIRAEELREELRTNPRSHPFDKVIFCNIGNPQQLGQKPLTFFRQVRIHFCEHCADRTLHIDLVAHRVS
jgi:alanine transaminase